MKNEDLLRNEGALKLEERRRLEEMRQLQVAQNKISQEIGSDKQVNKYSNEHDGIVKNGNITKPFDQVHAYYKFVMNNLDKENEAFRQSKLEKTHAMKSMKSLKRAYRKQGERC